MQRKLGGAILIVLEIGILLLKNNNCFSVLMDASHYDHCCINNLITKCFIRIVVFIERKKKHMRCSKMNEGKKEKLEERSFKKNI